MANNWITKRAQETGHSLHDRTGAKAKGPLRLVTGVLNWAESIFDYSYVELECGHKGRSYNTSPVIGTTKARCRECGKDANVEGAK
jgi:hypothetical protein